MSRSFGGRERFAQPFTELRFPSSWLARRQLHSNPELQLLLKTQADYQLTRLQRGAALSARLEQLLAASDPRDLPSIARAARELGMSSRTLARKLNSEGMTFAALVAQRRISAARSLLAGGMFSVREVADAMGFGDAPAFHKAFRRWTGLTPLQYAASLTRV